MNSMLKTLGTSHTGFFHEGRPRAAGRIAIAATLRKPRPRKASDGCFRTCTQAASPHRPAFESGDILLKVGNKELVPPEAMPFVLGETYSFTVRRADRSIASVTVTIPGSKEKQRPIVVPDQVVNASKLPNGTGMIRVSMFPGVLGMDVARDISRAITELECERLVIDLRGNTGGGIGCLRLMSHLCPDRRGVGYSVSRAVARRGFDKERLPAFDRIPSSKLGVVPLIVRFAGAAPFRCGVYRGARRATRITAQVAMLVNEHSASAAEMVAAFASEYRVGDFGRHEDSRQIGGDQRVQGWLWYRVVLPVGCVLHVARNQPRRARVAAKHRRAPLS